MSEHQVSPAVAPSLGLLGVYLKRGMAVIVGIALAIGLYLYVVKGQPAAQGVQQATVMCSCPSCGTMIENPTGLDCEELSCPSCGSRMGTAAMLAAATGADAPLTQHQQEALLDPGAGYGGIAAGPGAGGGAARLVRAPAAGMAPEGAVCVCPNCGKQIRRQPGVDCSLVVCPNCHSQMTNPVYVGAAGQQTPAGEMLLAGMPGPMAPAQGNAGAAAAAPCPHAYAAPTAPTCPATAAPQPSAQCPGAGAGFGHQQVAGALTPAATGTATPVTTYSDTVRPILEKNCYRCHSGAMRNLTTYSSVKSYADSGLLLMMTQPGGPMSRFLSASEYHALEGWARSGAAP